MKGKRFTEEQIIGAIKQLEAGRTVVEIGREIGVSKHTIYGWKAKFGGMSVSDAQRLKQLEDENRRLKQIVADLSLDKEALRGGDLKKRVELVGSREDVAWMMRKFPQ